MEVIWANVSIEIQSGTKRAFGEEEKKVVWAPGGISRSRNRSQQGLGRERLRTGLEREVVWLCQSCGGAEQHEPGEGLMVHGSEAAQMDGAVFPCWLGRNELSRRGQRPCESGAEENAETFLSELWKMRASQEGVSSQGGPERLEGIKG